MQKLLQAIASNPKTGLKRINLGKNSVDDRGRYLHALFGTNSYAIAQIFM